VPRPEGLGGSTTRTGSTSVCRVTDAVVLGVGVRRGGSEPALRAP
jgi:hypothetical protein